MRRRGALAAAGLALGGAGAWQTGLIDRETIERAGTETADAVDEATSDPEREPVETAIDNGLMDIRDNQNLPELSTREPLREAAREHSADMAERDFYAHENPDGVGPSGRAGCQAGEVIHRGELNERMRNPGSDEVWRTDSAEAIAGFVVEGWRRSASHLEVIVGRRWSAVGVGVHLGEEEFFATAVFC